MRAWLAYPLCLAIPLCSAAADETPNPPALRWGGDQEGGGPFIYPDDEDPSRVVGFEVDLAEELGKQLGQPAEFVQGSWDQLLPQLHRGDVDLVLNGYEYTPERSRQYLASFPYYIYELGLAARTDNGDLTSWEDLARHGPNGEPWRIGVLGGSSADHYVTEEYGDTCTIFRYDGSTEALRLIETGQLDATVQDLPILQFYIERRQQYPQLNMIDRPVAPGYYVIYARPDDGELMERVNAALRTLYESGRIREIYERYGIWNDAQSRLPDVWREWDSRRQSSDVGTWWILRLYVPQLVEAAGVTVALALLSFPLAMAAGLALALIRAWDAPSLGATPETRSPWNALLRVPAGVYIEVVRGTPLAFQLFVVYFILPEAGVTVSPFWAGVIALAVNYSAYEAEIFRLGLQAIPRGQVEAALALGMPRGLALRRIVLPQAFRIVIPASANDFIALFKDTAVCSVIAVEELSKQYSMGAKSTGLFIEMALMASVLYLAMSYPLSLLSRWLEQRLKREPGH